MRLALILLLLTVPEGAQPQTGRTIRHYQVADPARQSPLVDEAEAAIAKDDLATAEFDLNQVIQQNQADYRVWYDLGFVEKGLGKNADAIASYSKAIELNPDLFEATLNLGVLQAASGDAKSAEATLRRATTLKPQANPEDGLAHVWLAIAELQKPGRPSEAAASVEQALQHAPGSAEAHLLLAQLEREQGQSAEAEKRYRRAAELGEGKEKAGALAGLVDLFTGDGRLPEAEAYLKEYLAAAPAEQQTVGKTLLGRVLAREGKFDEAGPLLESSHKANPGDEALTRDLADLYAEREHYVQAALLYGEAVAVHGDDPGLRYAFAKVLILQHRFAEAQEQLLASLKLDPMDGAAYGDLAIVAAENKQYLLSLQALDERAKFLPETPGTIFRRATAYDNLQDFSHAADNYKRFLAASNGKYPDQEWQARRRLVAIEK